MAIVDIVIIVDTLVDAALRKFMSALFTLKKHWKQCDMTGVHIIYIYLMYIVYIYIHHIQHASVRLTLFYSYFFKENILNINRGFSGQLRLCPFFLFVSSEFSVVNTIFHHLAFL